MAIGDQEIVLYRLSGIPVVRYNKLLSNIMEAVRKDFLPRHGLRKDFGVLHKIHHTFGGGEDFRDVFALHPATEPWTNDLADQFGVAILDDTPDDTGRNRVVVVCNHTSHIEVKIFFRKLGAFLNEKVAEILEEEKAVTT